MGSKREWHSLKQSFHNVGPLLAKRRPASRIPHIFPWHRATGFARQELEPYNVNRAKQSFHNSCYQIKGTNAIDDWRIELSSV